MKALKIAGSVLGVLAVLLLAGIAYVAASFDAARIKSELTRMVLEKKQRTLKIDGELSLSFWPRLGVGLGQATLSERGSDKVFAALESAQVSVQAMPLLSKRIVIDQVELGGVQVALLRHQDGTLNIDDLLAKDESPTVRFDIAGIKLANARLGWRDEISGADLAFTNLNLSTGHLANAARGKLELSTKLIGGNPKIDGAIQLSAIYDYDMDGRRFGASQLDARIAGLFADARHSIDARLDLSGIEGNPQALKVARLGLLLDATAGATAIKGNLSSTLVANLSAQTLELPRISGEIAVANPQMPMKQVKLPITGNLHADFAKQSAEAAASTQFDESKITAKFNLAKFVPLALDFAVDIDRLNVDKYLPPRRDGGKKLAPQLAEGPALSALKNLKLHGTVKIGVLQFGGAKASNVRLDLKATDGKLEMGKLASHLPG